jgi:beta-lactam-binding protein with PASTA domain
MIKIKTDSWLDVVKYVGIAIVLGVVITLTFFYVYLPATTNHGESITVPDLEGIPVEELQDFLVDRDFRYEIIDSVYSEDLPPLTVTRQFPKAGSKVKQNRKIFISVNSVNPPSTKMPDLIDKTLKNAELILKSYELKRGKVMYKPDPFRNVLEQHYLGDTIAANTKLPKGSVIDIVIGDGHGISHFELPDLTGLPLEEAEVIIRGNSLVVGLVFETDSLLENAVVVRHSPAPGRTVRVGSTIDLWLGDPSELPEKEDKEE